MLKIVVSDTGLQLECCSCAVEERLDEGLFVCLVCRTGYAIEEVRKLCATTKDGIELLLRSLKVETP